MTDEQTPAAGPSVGDRVIAKSDLRKHPDGPVFIAKGDEVQITDHYGINHCIAVVALSDGRTGAWAKSCFERPHVASPASSSSVVQGDASGVERDKGDYTMALAEVQPFEDFPALADHIERMATTGRIGSLIEWEAFLIQLNATILSLHPQPTAAPVSRPGDGVEGESVQDAVAWLKKAFPSTAIGFTTSYRPTMTAVHTVLAALTPPAEPVSRPAGEGEAVARQIQALLAIKNPSHPVPGLARELLQRAAALLSPAAPDAGGGFNPTHRHVKRGTTYQVLGEARLQQASQFGPVEGDSITFYRGEDGQLWARAASEFEDGRFSALQPGGER